MSRSGNVNFRFDIASDGFHKRVNSPGRGFRTPLDFRRVADRCRRDRDVDQIRRDFPILAQTINGKPLIYLDNAASSQKPHVVIDTLTRYYREDHANIHRAVHALSVRATEAYEAARVQVQRFVGAERSEEIVFVRGATEG
ncbi:MAG: aminotransferase class V-fold PLP-dependent enzyme, partial [Planctomycetes bacterium]|nr:aminotransferase class V-fold PLP-dependent enzyme [Planctomycetota bacterium]